MAEHSETKMPPPGDKHPGEPQVGSEQAQKQHGLPRVQPTQPEDATHTTGAGKQMNRQPLEDNVQGKEGHRSEHSVPAQHATGSYTDDKHGQG
jgi:hypothetical protein